MWKSLGSPGCNMTAGSPRKYTIYCRTPKRGLFHLTIWYVFVRFYVGFYSMHSRSCPQDKIRCSAVITCAIVSNKRSRDFVCGKWAWNGRKIKDYLGRDSQANKKTRYQYITRFKLYVKIYIYIYKQEQKLWKHYSLCHSHRLIIEYN